MTSSASRVQRAATPHPSGLACGLCSATLGAAVNHLGRYPCARCAVGGALLGWLLALARPAAAQPVLEPPVPEPASLPPVPVLRLALPVPPTPAEWLQREGPTWLSYTNALVPREYQGVRADELRLELETGRVQLGRLSVTGQISTVPGRERDCEPDCRGAGWSSSLRLKYETGTLGPLRETGPELKLGGQRAGAGMKRQGLVRGGFSGKF